MCTGDHSITAAAVADELGIPMKHVTWPGGGSMPGESIGTLWRPMGIYVCCFFFSDVSGLSII